MSSTTCCISLSITLRPSAPSATHAEAPDDRTRAELGQHKRMLELVRETVRVEREALLQLRDTATIGDEVMRRVERNLDLEETRFSTEDR